MSRYGSFSQDSVERDFGILAFFSWLWSAIGGFEAQEGPGLSGDG